MNPANAYRTYRIARIRQDNDRVRTYFLDGSLASQPGQFCMVWLPGVNEKPFSIMDSQPLTFNVAAVGDFTRKLAALKEGDKFTLRGPYGNGFSLKGNEKSVLLVGGGYGVAPLYNLAKYCLNRSITPVMVIGARTAGDVLLRQDFESLGVKTVVATNDGSLGIKGFATDAAAKVIGETQFDAAFSCGPEKMMLALSKICLEENSPCSYHSSATWAAAWASAESAWQAVGARAPTGR